MTTALIQLFLRDLDRLKTEVEAYKSAITFWKATDNISNSAGNLTIHLIGNLNHFIGARLGKTDYVRDRNSEFNNKNVSRKLIIEQIEEAKGLIKKVLSKLETEDLQKKYPIEIRKEDITTEQFLLHLYGHFNYHLGQINYHRRILE